MAVVKKKRTNDKGTEASKSLKVKKEKAAKRKLEEDITEEVSSEQPIKLKGTAATPKKVIKNVVKKTKKQLFEEEEGDEENLTIKKLDGLGFEANDDEDDAMPDDFDNSDDDDLPIEKKSKALDAAKEQTMKEAEEELQLNIANQEKFVLPTVEEIEAELKSAPNLEIVRQRIADVIQVLGDFKNRRDPNKSREQYLDVLRKDLCNQYGYNDYLMGKFMDLFPNGAELLEFLEANDNPRPVTIRANSLKVKRRDLAKNLIARGMNVDPAAEWTKVGLVVYDSQVPVGATPEYLAGHYMIQGLNSLLPVMALAPQPGDRVLDMCAAPGGKTSHIAALMKNSGVLFANDANFARCRAIIGNLHRLGVNNTVVCNLNGEEFAKIRPNGFDRILLDAPCSGTGVIWKDQTVKTSKDSQDVQRRHTVQRQLILSAFDALDANSPNGGYLVYSTCSVLVEENEAVVNFLLQKRHCELVQTGLPIGVDGFTRFRDYRFHPSLSLTKQTFECESKQVRSFRVRNIGSGARANKKKRNQRKSEEKRKQLEADDGFNTVGFIKKAKKEKSFVSKVPKRAAARKGAKSVKNRRKKILAKQQ
ncbi:unnamed protein product [Caenorhabditis bovis]|uniref:SAM-dependent MTase RsmB/NOP-type domain-containing protein n=1 Tax=Caenorhabditis bovis TaxID=2654633 RepID=A0A8S1F4L1_9PELO|nr:unnamed protein product [Caenorhabditis bovis]